jgi:hypothetical protein
LSFGAFFCSFLFFFSFYPCGFLVLFFGFPAVVLLCLVEARGKRSILAWEKGEGRAVNRVWEVSSILVQSFSGIAVDVFGTSGTFRNGAFTSGTVT